MRKDSDEMVERTSTSDFSVRALDFSTLSLKVSENYLVLLF